MREFLRLCRMQPSLTSNIYVSKNNLIPLIFISLSPERWDYRCIVSCHKHVTLGLNTDRAWTTSLASKWETFTPHTEESLTLIRCIEVYGTALQHCDKILEKSNLEEERIVPHGVHPWLVPLLWCLSWNRTLWERIREEALPFSGNQEPKREISIYK